jgi:alpha-tubulin suppressor-like RCC1 family protein
MNVQRHAQQGDWKEGAMIHAHRSRWTLRAGIALVLCAALVTDGAFAAAATLQTIAVTPNAPSITVGQTQTFTATGTFRDGSKQALGPDIANMALGYATSCALLTSGGVECWGNNFDGELGDGSTENSLIPRSVEGIGTATAVAFNPILQGHVCALLASGTVQCWGFNAYGALGDGTTNSSTTPVSVNGIGTATAVGVGGLHSCALLASGAVECWGWNAYGQLGDGSHTNSSIPVAVTGIGTAIALAVGEFHSCALLASGEVQCWGQNFDGRLGNGTAADSNMPVTVRGISSATAITAGAQSTCALLANGAVKCWGSNGHGQRGDDVGADSSIPVYVTGLGPAIAITAGEFHNCAALRDGPVKCWGANSFGQLGNGVGPDSFTPVRVRTINAPVRLAAGQGHTCALLSGGAAKCWGWDKFGQLGNRRRAYTSPPVRVVGTPGVVWQSSDPSRATITDRGLATGRAVGSTTITATTAGFINDNAVLTVK